MTSEDCGSRGGKHRTERDVRTQKPRLVIWNRAAFQELTESDLSAVEGRKLFFDALDKCPEVISYFYGCDFSGIGIEFDPDCCPNLEETVDMVICL